MPAKKKQRTKVKDLPGKEKELTKKEQKQVKGGGHSQGGLITSKSAGINPVQHSE